MSTTLNGPVKVNSTGSAAAMFVTADGNLVMRPVTPVAEVKASNSFTLNGSVAVGESVSIGSREYVFGENVDISEGTKTTATGTVIFQSGALDGDILTIGSRNYEFTLDGTVSEGNVAVDISNKTTQNAYNVLDFGEVTYDGTVFSIGDVNYCIHGGTDKPLGDNYTYIDISSACHYATATLTFADTVTDGETVTIDGKTYEFDTNGSITAGNIKVGIPSPCSANEAVTALYAIVQSDNDNLTYSHGAGESLIVSFKQPIPDTEIDVAVSTTCVNATWDKAKLAGGAYPVGSEVAAIVAEATIADYTLTVDTEDTAKVIFTYKAIGTEIACDTPIGGAAWLFRDKFYPGYHANISESITALAAAITADTEADVTCVADVDSIAFSSKISGYLANALPLVSTNALIIAQTPTLTGATDATKVEAIAALVAAITADASAEVTAAIDENDTAVMLVEAKAIGELGNEIPVSEDTAQGSFDGDFLEGGINGTPGVKGQIAFDATNLYICTADTTNGSAWRKVQLSTL